jgi:hypothetical protein
MAYQQNDFGGNALDNYLTGKVARREFLRRMALLGGGAMVGPTLLGSLACESAPPTPAATTVPTTLPEPEPRVTVDPNDPRLRLARWSSPTPLAQCWAICPGPKRVAQILRFW